jgi:FTR1 family protein
MRNPDLCRRVPLGNPNKDLPVLPTFIIGLREGVEAALIVGIVATFLSQEGRRDALRPMWAGVLGAVAICVAVGVLLELLDQELPQRQQEGLETVVGAAAVAIVSFMIVWMRRHARDLSGALRRGAGAALARGSTTALVGMAFFAVIREGLETVVFLLAVFQNAEDPTAAGAGAILGLVAAVGIGALIYTGGIRLDLGRFFRLTGAVLVLVAAGLVASTLHTAHEAGWLNVGQGQALDLTWLVVPGTWTSALLTGMLGWQPQPSYAELIGYVAYLVPAALYVLWPAGRRLPGQGRRAARTAGAATLLVVAALVLDACGSGGSGSSTAGGARDVAVKLTDAGCDPAEVDVDAGRTTFRVTNAGTGRVSEMEVLDGARILGEKENLVTGLSGTFTLNLEPGTYTLSCPGGASSATGVLKVGGTAAPPTNDPQLKAATTGYREYVYAQAQVLVRRVRPFVADVKAGHVSRAKARFARARAPYERIEPVAESFGNLDPEIDARVNDVKPGTRWTGFHRIEQALWVGRTTAGMGPVADKLLADCLTLERKTHGLNYQPEELANGANGLLDEVASSKITGEEDRYSHTDLTDFEANVAGSQATFGLLAPTLRKQDKRLATTIERRFAAVTDELASLKRRGRFPGYATVGATERKHLSVLVKALAAPMARIADRLGG